MLELMILSRGRATATKENKRDHPTDERKTRWEQTTIKSKRRRSVKCTYSNTFHLSCTISRLTAGDTPGYIMAHLYTPRRLACVK